MTMDMNQKQPMTKKMSNFLCLDGQCEHLIIDNIKLHCKIKCSEFWDVIPGYLYQDKQFIQCKCYRKGTNNAETGL